NTLLFGSDATHVVERCRPSKAMFLGSEGCTLRYQLRVRDARSGRPWECLVLGRLFADTAAAAAYWRTLGPLVARLDGRPEAAPSLVRQGVRGRPRRARRSGARCGVRVHVGRASPRSGRGARRRGVPTRVATSAARRRRRVAAARRVAPRAALGFVVASGGPA